MKWWVKDAEEPCYQQSAGMEKFWMFAGSPLQGGNRCPSQSGNHNTRNTALDLEGYVERVSEVHMGGAAQSGCDYHLSTTALKDHGHCDDTTTDIEPPT